MKIPIKLTYEQQVTIHGIEAEACETLLKMEDDTVDVQNLNNLKKICMEFLQYPIIQALSGE